MTKLNDMNNRVGEYIECILNTGVQNVNIEPIFSLDGIIAYRISFILPNDIEFEVYINQDVKTNLNVSGTVFEGVWKHDWAYKIPLNTWQDLKEELYEYISK